MLLPGVPEALKAFKDQGYKLVVITNQAGVARGYYTEEDVKELHRYMNELLAGQGAGIDAFYYCPHHPEHGIGKYKIPCHCRKPETGMFEMAEQDFEVDKASSWMIGDKLIDIEAGRNYGVRTVLVGTGYGAGVHDEQKKKGVAVVFIGEDLDVLMQLSDRIMVMCGGKVSGIVDPRKVTKEEIGLMMIRTEQDGEKEEVTE